MSIKEISAGLVFLSVLLSSIDADAAIFLNQVVESDFVTPFNSGDITGPADGGGIFLSDTLDPPENLGFFVGQFSEPVGTGDGFDIEIAEVNGQAEETADIFLSSDGLSFTFIDSISGLNSAINFDDLFTGPANFIKIVGTSDEKAIDIDSVQGNFSFVSTPTAVPESDLVALLMALAVCLGLIKAYPQQR